MSEPKHTPGPWRNSVMGSTHGPDGKPIMTAGDGCRTPEGEEGRANARLIAAAPELLAALKAFAAAMRKGPRSPELLDLINALHVADAAIAKAEQ